MTKLQEAPPVTLPSTVEESVDFLLERLNDEQMEIVRSTPSDQLIRFHIPFGMQVRNMLGMWSTNIELVQACGVNHPDDASSVIIEALWRRLQT